MHILNLGNAKRMSAIIGVCGTNFCTFVSDGRLVVSDGDKWRTSKEDFQKIVRINDKLIYGATGVFKESESLLDPLNVYPDKSGLTMRLAHKAILAHAEKVKDKIPCARNYLLGGKDNKGNFCIYEIHINFETYEVETAERKPEQITETTSTFGISCALPSKLIQEKEHWINKVEQCILSSKYHQDMIDKISGVIGEIADKDDTVGKKIYTLTVQ